MIRAVITDLDRTLLKNDKTISGYTLKVLGECKEKGVRLVAATARPQRAIVAYEDQVGFDAAITLNGAIVKYGNETKINSIGKETAMKILGLLSKLENVTISLETSAGLFSNEYIPEWSPIVYPNLTEAPIPDEIYKILISSRTLRLDGLLPMLLPKEVYCSNANGDLFQIMSSAATKWNGIRDVLGHMNIDAADTAYFGDDNDDLEAIKECGLGIAVSNAIDTVKAAADAVTLSNEQDGVAAYLAGVLELDGSEVCISTPDSAPEATACSSADIVNEEGVPLKLADAKIRQLADAFASNPDAQYMLRFKGRSVSATFGECYENTASNGDKYLSISFWDSDSGNLFDIDYRRVPEAVFMDGKQLCENISR